MLGCLPIKLLNLLACMSMGQIMIILYYSTDKLTVLMISIVIKIRGRKLYLPFIGSMINLIGIAAM